MQAKHDTTMYCYRACICNEDYYNSEPLQLMQSIHVFCICVDSFFSFVSEHQKCTQFIMHPSTQSLIQSFPLTHSVPLTISMHRFTDSHPGFLPLSPMPFFQERKRRRRGKGGEGGGGPPRSPSTLFLVPINVLHLFLFLQTLPRLA